MRRALWSQALTLAIVLIAAAGASAQTEPAGMVTAVTGQLQGERPGAGAVDLGLGSPVYVGQTLRTAADAKATLLFNDGSLVRLNAGTTIEITPPTAVGRGKRSLIRLTVG